MIEDVNLKRESKLELIIWKSLFLREMDRLSKATLLQALCLSFIECEQLFTFLPFLFLLFLSISLCIFEVLLVDGDSGSVFWVNVSSGDGLGLIEFHKGGGDNFGASVDCWG